MQDGEESTVNKRIAMYCFQLVTVTELVDLMENVPVPLLGMATTVLKPIHVLTTALAKALVSTVTFQ